MITKVETIRLRLPVSLAAAVETLCRQHGTDMNQFMVSAVAEKLSAMQGPSFFDKHGARADRATFTRILNRKGGEPPRPGDELPPV